ncbi:unnamed protein product, partial [Soboliphyme baturini]|uniref:NHL repeat containing 2 n=1 Tax=Soboliphyme baturini TaxID=241478 RepID=A0A183J8Z1_9BILA
HGVTPSTFGCPAAIACDVFGNVLVADAGNCRVQIFDLTGKFLKIIQYPTKLKEKVQSKSVILPVSMQTLNGVLYLLDLRMETIYWIRYL